VKTDPPPQMNLFSGGPDAVRDRLELVDVSVLTPLEALNLLDELKKLL
jgi:DNA mismatch repair protein MutS